MQIQENKNLLIELAIKAGKETLKYFRKKNKLIATLARQVNILRTMIFEYFALN